MSTFLRLMFFGMSLSTLLMWCGIRFPQWQWWALVFGFVAISTIDETWRKVTKERT